jgi:hypothetical protein
MKPTQAMTSPFLCMPLALWSLVARWRALQLKSSRESSTLEHSFSINGCLYLASNSISMVHGAVEVSCSAAQTDAPWLLLHVRRRNRGDVRPLWLLGGIETKTKTLKIINLNCNYYKYFQKKIHFQNYHLVILLFSQK